MLDQVIVGAATRFADTAALTTPAGWSLTYGQLDRFSDEAAAGFAARGIAEGDVVALVLPSGCEYAVAYGALAKLGAITVGVNPVLAPGERTTALEVVGAKAVVTTGALSDGVPAEGRILVEPATRADDVLAELRVDDGRPAPLEPDPTRPVAIVLTSGTTGRPKGAVFTGAQLAAITRYDLGEDGLERWGGGGPMLAGTQFAHIGFMTKFAWYVRTGATLMLLDRWRAADVLDVVERSRMAVIGGVAPQVALMLRDPRFEARDLSCVQALIVGGAPSPPALVLEARARFGAGYSIRYSSTESGGVGTGTAFDAPDDEALHTVGRPRPGMDLEIRDDEGHPLPAGEVGEVCIRSGAVMDRYWNDPEATAATLRDGWLHTGDLGLLDDSGCLTLAGRKKEMYIRGGYNVYPMEVEAVLGDHPGVEQVAVVPRPDPVMGEVGVAAVVPAPGADAPNLASLRAFAVDRLAGYKLPEELILVESLPLTPGQKLDRRALAQLVA